MEANEAQELQEHAEHAEGSNALRPVALTMTILAVLVAVVTVLGHRTHTEAILSQDRATDQWGEYQAKKIRAYDTQLTLDLMNVLPLADKDAAHKLTKSYADHQAKWTDDLKDVQGKAEAQEKLVEKAEAQAKFFDLGEVLLEIGLVITSITLLTRRRIYWYAGLGFSVIGIVAATMGLLLK
ncbi:MAG: DUF4337 domain-containing protein [Terracidiphilus sp.]|jgi:hypothetical protein